MNTIQEISYHERLEEEHAELIWDILCECNWDFVPPLSSRKGTHDVEFDSSNSAQEPTAYFEVMKEQPLLIAREAGVICAFLSYRHSETYEFIKDWCPCNFVTTICVKHDYTGRGNGAALYDWILNDLPDDQKCSSVVARTWSTNRKKERLLRRAGFEEIGVSKNHRGAGIDTIYFAKRI